MFWKFGGKGRIQYMWTRSKDSICWMSEKEFYTCDQKQGLHLLNVWERILYMWTRCKDSICWMSENEPEARTLSVECLRKNFIHVNQKQGLHLLNVWERILYMWTRCKDSICWMSENEPEARTPSVECLRKNLIYMNKDSICWMCEDRFSSYVPWNTKFTMFLLCTPTVFELLTLKDWPKLLLWAPISGPWIDFQVLCFGTQVTRVHDFDLQVPDLETWVLDLDFELPIKSLALPLAWNKNSVTYNWNLRLVN